MPVRRASQCKVKATKIPKPAKGSGLNPSGLPVADQLHLPAEQPRMLAFDFDPYGQSGLGWPGYDNVQEQASSFFGDVQPEGPSLYNNPPGPLLYDNPLGPSSFNNLPGPSLYDNSQGPLSFDNPPGPSLYDNLQGASLYNERLYYKDTQNNSSLGPSHH